MLMELDQAISRRSLLKHPFYRNWQAGTLTQERLLLYAKQYYLHVEAFPVHLQRLAERAQGSLRQLILENLADETDPMAPHARLWRNFAEAVGVRTETFWTTVPLPGIRKLLDVYGRICAEASMEEAGAALYAYEAQVPEISSTKKEGLSRYYGIKTEGGLAYFRVHEQADRIHREAWRGWLEKGGESGHGYQPSVEEEQILATTQKALDALWGALDSVQEAVL